jgi:hypothetical protein
MERTQDKFGITAVNYTHLQSSDEQQANNDATATPRLLHLLQSLESYQHTPAASQGLSSPQERYGEEAAFNGYDKDAVTTPAEYNHPPTPPRQEEEILKLLRWHAEEHTKRPGAEQVPQRACLDGIADHYGHARSSSISQSSLPNASSQSYQHGGSNAIPTRQAQPYGMGYYQYQQLPAYGHPVQHAQRFPYQTPNELAGHISQVSETNSRAPSQSPSNTANILPPNHDRTFPYTQGPLSIPQPPIQQWPARALGQHASPIIFPCQRTHTLSNASVFGPSPGHDGVTSPDKTTLRRQQAFQKRAEKQRQRRESGQMEPPLGDPSFSGTKRKEPPQNFQSFASTPAPPLRTPSAIPHGLPHGGGYHVFYGPAASVEANHGVAYRGYGQRPEPQAVQAILTNFMNPYAPISTLHPRGMPYGAAEPIESNYEVAYVSAGQLPTVQEFQANPTNYTSSNMPVTPQSLKVRRGRPKKPPVSPNQTYHPPKQQSPLPEQPSLSIPESAPLAPIDWDAQPQDITRKYEDYKWSITLYELNADCGFDFAQAWLEYLFETNKLIPPNYKWHAHTTQGFIKDGGRLSFIVLHNAANPFERGLPPTSTTSIGVYGRDWQEHDEIHWKTFAPDIRWLLDYCKHNGRISVKQTWKFDHPRATERRFHRAYWRAARMDPIRDLLKHREMVDDVHDALEGEVNDGFEVSEVDLQGGKDWNNTAQESEEAWKRVVEQNEEIGNALEGTTGYEHVVTGSSEMEEMMD